MKTDLFQSCGHHWVFQICWHIECSTFTASSFRIWNSSTGILSPPLALFEVILPKAHLTSHSSHSAAAAAAKSPQSCLTLWHPIDGSPPGSPIPGVLQARTLEWVAISFSNSGKWKVKVKLLSYVWLLATPWTAAYQLLHPWDSPGKSTGVGCHCLLPFQPYRDVILFLGVSCIMPC